MSDIRVAREFLEIGGIGSGLFLFSAGCGGTGLSDSRGFPLRRTHLATARAGLPDRSYTILLNAAILGHQWHSLYDSLGHENAVERIFVQFGKTPERHHVRRPDRKRGNSCLDYVLLPPWERILEQSVLLTAFQDQFPKAGYTDSDLRLGQYMAGWCAEQSWVR